MKRILVPVDFSPVAENAAQYAVQIAEAANKEIVFFHAGVSVPESRRQRLNAGINGDGDTLVKTRWITAEEPFNGKSISEIAGREHIRLIIMGTVGAGAGLYGSMFGSNAVNLVTYAQCPVMLVPPAHRFRWINKIGFASDLLNFEHEIGKIIAFARIFNAEIRIFHVSPVFPDLGTVEKFDLREKIELVKRLHQYANISYCIEEMPVDNEIDEGINRFLDQKEVDLLAIFHRRGQLLEGIFSSGHPHKAVTHLMVPLQVYPKD
jgi:nucleotide-binding universal stress UspA family protein